MSETTLVPVPVVLVHGNPETPAVWDLLVDHLGDRPVFTPNLPGFGCSLPDGFDATMDSYAAWLISEIEAVGQPIHLVGHDWGGILAIRVAELRPDLLVSWASDAAGLFHPGYVWHDMARVWQTPGDGEAVVEAMAVLPTEDAVTGFVTIGIPREQAEVFVAAIDDTFGACVLSLYRSATTDLLTPWRDAAGQAGQRPGLALRATDDPYVGDDVLVAEAADRLGADLAVLDGCSHWWMLQSPAESAALLTSWFQRTEG
jgi:pimeloyl-ACP methyl ester carboxylesterase